MDSPRSRKDSQAETRTRLLEVAAKVLREHGYSAASVEKIADAAGYSKGAVYSNFAGKEELTLEVLDRQFAHRLEDLRVALQGTERCFEARLDAFVGWWEEMLLDEGWGIVIFEFAGATRDNPKIQDELAARERTIVSFCESLIQNEVETFGLDLPMTCREIASVLVSLGEGLAFSRILDPTIPADVLVKTARVLFLGADRTPRSDGQPV